MKAEMTKKKDPAKGKSPRKKKIVVREKGGSGEGDPPSGTDPGADKPRS